jgi:hypothetical protein
MEFSLDLVDKMSGPAKTIGNTLDKLFGVFQQGRNELGQFTSKTGPFTEGLEAIAPAAGVAIAAISALTAITAGLILEGAELSLEQSELKESMMASLESFTGSKDAAAGMYDQLEALRGSLGQSRETVQDWSLKLLGAGVSSAKLSDAMTAVASSAALMRNDGSKALAMIEKLNEAGMKGSKIKFSTSMLVGTGISEGDLMKALGMTPKQLELAKKQGKLTGEQLSDAMIKVLDEKGAGPLAAKANSLGAQWQKLKDNFMGLFADVDTSGFLASLKDLLSIFDQSTASGKAMKAGVTGAFNAIFSAAAQVFPYVKTAIEQVIIAGLRVYIALKPMIKAFNDAHVGGLMLKAVGLIISMIGSAALGAASGLVHIVTAAMQAYYPIRDAFNHAKNHIANAAQAVEDFIRGLVSGIMGGSGQVNAAIKQLGQGMLTTFKSTLGIASPSKEMMKLGGHVTAGFVQGVSASNDNVRSATGKMASTASRGAVSGGAAASGKEKGGGVTVGDVTINITGASGDAHDLTEQGITLIFERIALEQGLGLAA